MANTANANTARLDRWGRADWAGPRHDNYASRHDWQPHSETWFASPTAST